VHDGPSPEPGALHDDPLPEDDVFFNDALKKNIKVYAGMGAVVAGVSVGLTLGVQKLINDHSHREYVSAFFPLSCRPLTESQTF
jgi:hypothetical protein